MVVTINIVYQIMVEFTTILINVLYHSFFQEYLNIGMLRPESGKRVQRRVHNIMMKSFHPTDEEGVSVDHIDRNKYNNCLDNLRWAGRKTQQRNLDRNNRLDCGTLLRDKFDNSGLPETHYGFFFRYFRSGVIKFDRLLQLYRAKEKYGSKWMRLYEEDVYLWEWVEKYNLNFTYVCSQLDNSWTHQEILQGYRLSDHNVGLEHNNIWFPDYKSFCNKYGITLVHFKQNKHLPLQQILDCYEGYWWKGKYRTLEQVCDLEKVPPDTISHRIFKYGITIEQALVMKPQRITKHDINGVVKKNIQWYEYFGFKSKAKSANSYKARGHTFRDTLEHFGVDTTDMIIIPVTNSKG